MVELGSGIINLLEGFPKFLGCFSGENHEVELFLETF